MKPIIKTIQSFSWLLWITWNSDKRRETPIRKWLKRVWRMSKSINEWDGYKWLDKALTRQRKDTLKQKKINILNKE